MKKRHYAWAACFALSVLAAGFISTMAIVMAMKEVFPHAHALLLEVTFGRPALVAAALGLAPALLAGSIRALFGIASLALGAVRRAKAAPDRRAAERRTHENLVLVICILCILAAVIMLSAEGDFLKGDTPTWSLLPSFGAALASAWIAQRRRSVALIRADR